MNARIDIGRLLPAWQSFSASTDIGPVRDAAHYQRMVALLESLLDEAKGDEANPAMALVDIVGDLIANHESQQAPLTQASGMQALQFLIEQHGLIQSQLPEIGSQGVVSEVLAGKRALNLRQVKALAARFAVSPATFI